jgi:hypothetical protein
MVTKTVANMGRTVKKAIPIGELLSEVRMYEWKRQRRASIASIGIL